MKKFWLNSVFPIAALFSFRMLGLFMLIPVFTVYANHLTAATPVLIGVALGSYGLSQGLLQIPFGMLSDRFGRKPILTLGLILFIFGSLLGAFTTSIYGMIIARTIQGMGAIGSVLIALLADLTPDDQRTKAMAVIGVTIGLSFSLAMVISPALTHRFGLAGIFYFTAFLATSGLFLLHVIIPTPKKEPFHIDSEANPKLFNKVIRNHHLQRLNVGIFCQHFILTATFFTMPILLQQQVEQGTLLQQWHFYLPLIVLSFIAMLPFLTLAEKKQQLKLVFLGSVIMTGVCQFMLIFTYQHWLAICGFMFIYFVGFNILEASLPSLISRQAGPESKGTAMGIYSSSQFLGIFAGGAVAGVIYQYWGSQGIFIVNSLIALLWSIITLYIKPYVYQVTLILPYDNNSQDTTMLYTKLSKLAGVKNVVIATEEGAIYLRVDKIDYQHGSAERLIAES
jgi:MFS family permease